jgi:hypothetical protein
MKTPDARLFGLEDGAASTPADPIAASYPAFAARYGSR